MSCFRLIPIFLGLVLSIQPARAQVNVLAMGDWGTNGPRQREMAQVLADYTARQDRPIDAMLLAGDNFYPKLSGIDDPLWQQAFEQMYDPAKLNFPFYPAFGNHDYKNEETEFELAYSKAHPESRWRMPARWYRIDWPREKPIVTVLMLDSNQPMMGEQLWNDQLQWIADELQKPRAAPWLICVAHHPLFSNGDHGDNGVLQKAWGPLFKQHNVDFYICGHDHDIQHLESPDSTTSFLLVGGGGATTRPMRQDNRGPFSHADNGFAHLQFTASKATARLINRRGEVVHEFERDRSGKIDILQSIPSDIATPRTVKSITRGGEETPASATAPSK